jgi:hypothetical protein
MCQKYKYEPIKNCHMENALLGKDFNFGAIGLLFHAFTHDYSKSHYNTSLHKILQSWPTFN